MIRRLMIAAAALLATVGVAQAKPELPPPVRVEPVPFGAKARPVTLVRTVIALKDGEEWATVGKALGCDLITWPVRWNSAQSEVSLDRLRPVVEEEFAAAGFRKGGRDLFSDDDGDGLQLGLRIDDMEGRFCSFDGYGFATGYSFVTVPTTVRGSLRMTAEWQVYDPMRREVVARIHTVAGGEQKERTRDGVEGVIIAAVRESARALLADETFRKIVLAEQSAAPPAPADLGPITLAGSAAAAPRAISDVPGSVVTIFSDAGMGSGFLVSRDGYLITNHHVVGSASVVRIRWSDGFESQGQVIRSDKRRDVALVKTDPHGRAPLALRRDSPPIGDRVFAVGTPLKETLQNTVTQGIISANRVIDGFAFIQSDVVVDHGNSGGPLLDEKGRVVGITEMTLVNDGTQRGLNAFIPIGDALDFLKLKAG